jgi:hypothetical protein
MHPVPVLKILLQRHSVCVAPAAITFLAAPRKNHRRERPRFYHARFKRVNNAGRKPPAGEVRQNRPTTLPSSVRSILSEDGTLGKPGMVMMSPQIITMNSAPAASLTSRMLTI